MMNLSKIKIFDNAFLPLHLKRQDSSISETGENIWGFFKELIILLISLTLDVNKEKTYTKNLEELASTLYPQS